MQSLDREKIAAELFLSSAVTTKKAGRTAPLVYSQ